jgi:hypothetical protein
MTSMKESAKIWFPVKSSPSQNGLTMKVKSAPSQNGLTMKVKSSPRQNGLTMKVKSATYFKSNKQLCINIKDLNTNPYFWLKYLCIIWFLLTNRFLFMDEINYWLIYDMIKWLVISRICILSMTLSTNLSD